jgi:RNA polymerase sigma-70 factor (ECF subfamily)
MQEIQRSNKQFGELLARAKRIARKHGIRGVVDSDDIAQAAMVKLLMRDTMPPTAWLYKVVRSVAFDAGRKQRREAKYIATPALDNVEGAVCETADGRGRVWMDLTYIPERDEREPDLKPRLDGVLDQLNPAFRKVLVLYAEGYEYAEIAQLTKVSIGTVRSRLHYARKAAQELLGEVN